MMHKEVVGKKKAPVIISILLLITFMLYVKEGLEFVDLFSNRTLFFWNIVLAVLTITMIIGECISCKVAYKYAVIADKLIINKIFNNEERNLASIKIYDIVYLGRKNGEVKKYNAKTIGNYACAKLRSDQQCCVYKFENNYYKFYFEPSESFITKVHKKICNKNSQV